MTEFEEQIAEMKSQHQRELQKRDDEIKKLKTEHQKAEAELREHRLWTPAQKAFEKAGGDPKEWPIARLDLAEQKRFDLDILGDVVVMDKGVELSTSVEGFFAKDYKALRPKMYLAGGKTPTGTQLPANTIRRSDFDSLPPDEKGRFMIVNKGNLVD